MMLTLKKLLPERETMPGRFVQRQKLTYLIIGEDFSILKKFFS